jgi:hypothetical protein
MRDLTITSLSDYIGKVSAITKAETHQHLRCWFRGVPDADYKLIPSEFRSPSRKDRFSLEDDERHAFRDFRLWSAGMIPPSTRLEDIYFQQQLPFLLDYSIGPPML